MIRLIEKNNKNAPEEYDRIFVERTKKEIDDQDLRRWNYLLKRYNGGKLLDMGCLDSQIPILAKMYYPQTEIWGIDYAEKAMEIMRALHPNIYFAIQDLLKTNFKNEYFDYIILGEVLEHLEEPDKAVKEAMRILKSRGTLAVSVPLNEAREPGAVDGERHLWSFTANDILQLLKPYGNIKIKIIGSRYFPKYHYYWPTLIAWCKKK